MNRFHHRPIDLGGQGVHRRWKSEPIGGQRIGAQFDQELNHLWPVVSDCEVQRRLVILVTAQARAQRRRIGGNDAPHFVGEIHGDGGEDVMARAATE